MRLLTTTLSLAVITVCSVKIITASQAEIGNAPSITQDDAGKGKELYEANCGVCHKLKKITAYDETQWKSIVPKMVKKANKKNKDNKIDKESEALLLNYLVTNCKKAKKVKEVKEKVEKKEKK